MCVVPGNFHICLLFLFFLMEPLFPFIPTDLGLCAHCLTLTAIPTALILEAFSNLPSLLGVLGMPRALAQILLNGGTPNLLFPSCSELGQSKGESIPYFCQPGNPKCSLPSFYYPEGGVLSTPSVKQPERGLIFKVSFYMHMI